jgi:hypothetical protein
MIPDRRVRVDQVENHMLEDFSLARFEKDLKEQIVADEANARRALEERKLRWRTALQQARRDRDMEKERQQLEAEGNGEPVLATLTAKRRRSRRLNAS